MIGEENINRFLTKDKFLLLNLLKYRKKTVERNKSKIGLIPVGAFREIIKYVKYERFTVQDCKGRF